MASDAQALLRGLEIRFGADVRAFKDAMREVEAATKPLASKMKSVGSKMSRSFTVPLMAMGGAALKAFGDFDQAMTQSLSIMDGVTQQMEGEMAAAAKEMGAVTQFSARQAADSYYYLASAGMDAQQSLEALPAVAQFAQAGMFDMAQATDYLTDAQSALGMSFEDPVRNMRAMRRVSDTLVSAQNQANASVEQFSEALTNRAATSARSFGLSLESTVATLAAMADQGNKGARAGNQFSMALTNMTTAASENAAAFEANGVSVYDAQGNLRGMAQIIGDLEGALAGQTAQQKKATLAQLGFADRAQKTILSLVGTSDKIREVEENLKSAGGITEEVANEQLTAFNQQLKLVWGQVQNAGIALGEVLAPAASLVAGVVGKAAKAFAGLSEPVRTAVAIVGGLVAAIGPLAATVGTVLQVWPVLVAGFTAVTGPIGAAVAAVAALTAAGAALYKNWGEVSDYLEKAFPGALSTVKSAFDEAAKFVVQVWNALYNALRPVVEQITGLVVDRVRERLDTLAAFWERWGDTITNVVSAAFRTIKTVVLGVIGNLGTAMQAWLDLITGNFSGALGHLKELFSSSFSTLVQIVLGAVETVLAGLEGLVTKIPGVGGKLASGLGAARKAVRKQFEGMAGDAEGAAQAIAGSMDVAREAVEGTASGEASGENGGGVNNDNDSGDNEPHQGLLDTLGKLSDSLRVAREEAEAMGGPLDAAKGRVRAIKTAVRDLIKQGFDASSQSVQRLVDKLEEARVKVMKVQSAQQMNTQIQPVGVPGEEEQQELDLSGDMSAQIEQAVAMLNRGKSRIASTSKAIAATVSRGFQDAAAGMLEGIGKMAAGTQTLSGVMSSVMGTLASVAGRVGKIAIAVGIGVKGIRESLSKMDPTVALAAGAALIALSSFAQSALGRAANAGGGGAGASAPPANYDVNPNRPGGRDDTRGRDEPARTDRRQDPQEVRVVVEPRVLPSGDTEYAAREGIRRLDKFGTEIQ